MASEDGADGGASGDSREQGIEVGQLKEKLAPHGYPATGDELLDAYGDFELDLPGGSATLREVLGKRESESEGFTVSPASEHDLRGRLNIDGTEREP